MENGLTQVHLAEVRDLTVTFRAAGKGRITAVDNLSIGIRKGEILGILGESGCGKTTLAKAILRLLPADSGHESGEIFLAGRDLCSASEFELQVLRGRDVALIPQDPSLSLNPVMDVGSQIAEVLRAHLRLRAKERRARVMELLREVGFDRPGDVYGAYPHHLSGGQRQRIVISQAIACRPALLIADEATSKLDAPLQEEIVQLLRRIRNDHGTAIMVITHDPALLGGFADRVAVMYSGRIVEVGGTAEIFRMPLHPYTQALVRIAKSAAEPAQKYFPTIEGEAPDPGDFPAGCRFEARCPERMKVCAERYPQVFMPGPSRPVSCFKYGE